MMSDLFKLAFPLVLTLIAASTWAALPLEALKKAQKEAPELLQIEVTKITMTAAVEKESRSVNVEVVAKVIGVKRSASKLKVGDKVTIRWTLPSPKEQAVGDWARPVLADMDYDAYLAKDDDAYEPAAYSASFEALPIKHGE